MISTGTLYRSNTPSGFPWPRRRGRSAGIPALGDGSGLELALTTLDLERLDLEVESTVRRDACMQVRNMAKSSNDAKNERVIAKKKILKNPHMYVLFRVFRHHGFPGRGQGFPETGVDMTKPAQVGCLVNGYLVNVFGFRGGLYLIRIRDSSVFVDRFIFPVPLQDRLHRVRTWAATGLRTSTPV